METIIKCAIEGGYDIGYDENGGFIYTRDNLGTNGEVTGGSILSPKEITLDPLFWQSLGKACGWGKTCTCAAQTTKYGRVHDYRCKMNTWEHFSLSFHEKNLTEGWDSAVAYLLSVIK